jgi:hypothetical protein
MIEDEPLTFEKATREIVNSILLRLLKEEPLPADK